MKGWHKMELNFLLQEELRRLSELSTQLKDEENSCAELSTNRRKAEASGASLHELIDYSEQIEYATSMIKIIKNMIVEHVNVLGARTEAQGED